MKRSRFEFWVALAAALFACSPRLAIAQSWKPEQNVEISVATAPGGGADRTARFIQKLKFLASQYSEIRSVLTELGMAKSER